MLLHGTLNLYLQVVFCVRELCRSSCSLYKVEVVLSLFLCFLPFVADLCYSVRERDLLCVDFW